MTEYKTKTGKILTDADIEALAEQACWGYTLGDDGKWTPNTKDNSDDPDCPIHGRGTGARLEDL
jgi:hypothetical protein